MCGIIGYVGENNCVDYLVTGLKRLEYRGYDSAGVAVYTTTDPTKAHFEVVKSEGKLENIEAALKRRTAIGAPLAGKTGMGHTRWATHGKPDSINAHPHRAGKTVLVHNGIIENYELIREELLAKKYTLVSETDSELFGHLVEDQMKNGLPFEEAVRTSFLRLEGSCSIVVVHDAHPDKVIVVRNGTPVVAAFSKSAKGCFIASDAQAILDHARDVTFLENEDMVVCTKTGFKVYSIHKPIQDVNCIERTPLTLDWTPTSMDKAGFPHYMLKEIHEQPRAILDTLDHLIERETAMPRMENLESRLKQAKRIQLVACGTAWHASLLGKYMIEHAARVPVDVDLANEYRYRDPIVTNDMLMIAVSQSGETADTIAALREAKKKGAMTGAICNVRGSTISREVEVPLFTAAGPEIGVASTKAFTTQVLVLMMLAQYLAHLQKKTAQGPVFDLPFFLRLPHMIQSALTQEEKIKQVAKACIDSKGYLFIGRGRLYPIALEGALKMKEISYIHAEGYPAGELKHGPIAMVDPSMTVVVLAPRDELFEKTVSNLQEVKARGGRIVAIGTRGDEQLRRLSDHFLEFDFAHDWSDPLLASIPVQLLAYHSAVFKGTDVDKPRNLAKSVTVE